MSKQGKIVLFSWLLLMANLFFLLQGYNRSFTELRSQPLPTTLTHSHPFFKKNNPPRTIFRQKRHTPNHFSEITTHSHSFFKKKTYSYPFFDKSDSLPSFFRQKRHIFPHFIVKVFGHSCLDIFLQVLAPRIERIIQMGFPV